MKIRLLQEKDIPDATKIIGENYDPEDEALAKKELEAMFKNHTSKPTYLVAEKDGKVVGLSGYIVSWMDYNVYNIFWVNTQKSFQKQWIGTLLVEKTIENIKKESNADLILITATVKNTKWYKEKFHFKILKSLKGKNGEPDYNLMGLQL